MFRIFDNFGIWKPEKHFWLTEGWKILKHGSWRVRSARAWGPKAQTNLEKLGRDCLHKFDGGAE